jgi:retron-type reverse transcriptase
LKIHNDLFEKIVSLENLFDSWHGFRLGKKNKKGVSVFERHLEDNIFALHEELRAKSYRHDQYTSFYITDPKVRHIHKASVKDRVVHHAIFKILYPIFDPSFIHDSYSCRIDKGTHRAVKRLEQFIRKVGKNDSGQCFVLKCDIKKFFASVDQEILSEIIERRVSDPDLLWLMKEIVGSFSAESLDTQLSLFGPPTERERERERERETMAFGHQGKGFRSVILPASSLLTFT